MIDNLTEKNFLLFAAKFYEDPNCTDILEFQQDLDRIKYVKRLFKRYEEKGLIKDIQNILEDSNSFDFLNNEEDVYSEKDLKEKYND